VNPPTPDVPASHPREVHVEHAGLALFAFEREPRVPLDVRSHEKAVANIVAKPGTRRDRRVVDGKRAADGDAELALRVLALGRRGHLHVALGRRSGRRLGLVVGASGATREKQRARSERRCEPPRLPPEEHGERGEPTEESGSRGHRRALARHGATAGALVHERCLGRTAPAVLCGAAGLERKIRIEKRVDRRLAIVLVRR
jgi:hypothetical protein